MNEDLATRAQIQLRMQLSLEATSSELSIYDAAIAARTPLPAGIEKLPHKRSLRSMSVPQ
jgi:hypothetical protein